MTASDGSRRTKTVRKRLADGTIRVYRYDLDAIAQRKVAKAQERGWHQLAMLYYASPEFSRLSKSWQTATRKYVGLIGEEIDYMTLGDLSTREAKREFWTLRDKHAGTPAKADKVVSVLRRILGWAYLRDHIDYNHADHIERLVPPSHTRADKIWTPEDEAAFLTRADRNVADAWRLALYTLARESDLIGLRWEQFDGRWLVYTPSKTAGKVGTVVHLPVYALPPMAAMLSSLSRCSDYILTQRQGHPWSASNLSRQFENARKAAGLENADLTWHDLRGTGITRLYLAGCTDPEVASISGHVMGDRAQQRAYIARARELAVHAFEKLAGYLPTPDAKAHQRRNYRLGKDKK